jgi:glutamyl-tRNA synthetase
MIVTRFAPSPTGYLHIGGLRTALLNYLWAKRNGGKFLLRVEDTDRSRHNEDAVSAILEAFKWVGLNSDEEIVYQSQRDEIYKKYIDQLLQEGKAYKCYMTKEELETLREEQQARKERPRYDGRYRDFDGVPPEGVEPVIRIKAPIDGSIFVDDKIKGSIEFRVADTLDDFIIARADGNPTYNFVVAVDDALMGVNEVIRGDDHLSNTPKQIVVYNALGFQLPTFYHVPMIHNESGKKLSKRDGATDVMEYQRNGYLPDALLNFLIRLGWSNGDQEIFSMEEMLELFNPKDISKSASIYNLEKLNWINGEYIKSKSRDELAKALHIEPTPVIDLVKDRTSTLIELSSEVNKILNRPTEYDPKSIKKHFKELNRTLLGEFLEKLKNGQDSCDEAFGHILESNGAGMAKLAQPVRIALVGVAQSPSVLDVISILGRDEVIYRIESFLASQE